MCAAFFHVFFEDNKSPFFHGDLQLLGTFAATCKAVAAQAMYDGGYWQSTGIGRYAAQTKRSGANANKKGLMVVY